MNEIEESILAPLKRESGYSPAWVTQTLQGIMIPNFILYIKKETSIAIFNFITALISVAISMWLTYWAFWYFSYSLKMWKLSDLLYLPMFFAESAIFIGLVLMVFYALVELYDMVFDLMDTEKKAEV